MISLPTFASVISISTGSSLPLLVRIVISLRCPVIFPYGVKVGIKELIVFGSIIGKEFLHFVNHYPAYFKQLFGCLVEELNNTIMISGYDSIQKPSRVFVPNFYLLNFFILVAHSSFASRAFIGSIILAQLLFLFL